MLTNGNLALQAIDRAIINKDIAPHIAIPRDSST